MLVQEHPRPPLAIFGLEAGINDFIQAMKVADI